VASAAAGEDKTSPTWFAQQYSGLCRHHRRYSEKRYLIDTATIFSIFPHKSSAPPTGQKLTGPDGQIIPCWGKEKIVLVFHGRRYAWTFLLADVQFPIIVFPHSHRAEQCILVSRQPSRQLAMALVIKWVLDRFHEEVNPENWLLPKTKHGVEHHIRVKNPASGSREVCGSKSGV